MVRSTVFCKGDNFWDFLFGYSAHQSPSEKESTLREKNLPTFKGVYSKRKEFAPNGSKFFPFGGDPFSEARQNKADRVTFYESLSIPLPLNPL